MAKTDKTTRREQVAGTHPELVHIQAPRSIVLLVCIVVPLLVVGAMVTGFWVGSTMRQTGGPSQVTKTFAVQNAALHVGGTETYQAKAGPWGDLVCQRTAIEIPEEYLSIRLHESDIPRWFFKGFTTATLNRLLGDSNLSPKEMGDLGNTNRWEVLPAGIYIKPSKETILSLSEGSRHRIYSVLAQFEENAAQEQAFHWPVGSADELFAGAQITRQTLALVKRLCYGHGKLLIFADLSTVLGTLPGQAEKNRLEKALSRRSTLLVRLAVSPTSDIDSLIRYWGRAGTGKDIRPILEAAARIPEGTKLSILNLLPPWPTARLYTFPFPTSGAQLDCHWTSFNFYKDQPDPPTTDGAYWKRKLDTEYYPVTSDPRYGDIVMLAKSDGVIIHSCIFLADDIVYTKNGANATVPWILMTIPELVQSYSLDLSETETLRVNYYRNKNY